MNSGVTMPMETLIAGIGVIATLVIGVIGAIFSVAIGAAGWWIKKLSASVDSMTLVIARMEQAWEGHCKIHDERKAELADQFKQVAEEFKQIWGAVNDLRNSHRDVK